MPQGPAARITDNVAHPLPPVLTPGPGSPTVIIGFLLAWRAAPVGAGAAAMAANQAANVAINAAIAATAAAAGTPGAPAALAAEQTTKATALASTTTAITAAAGGADIHSCMTLLPTPPHGPGIVIDGSMTVMTNFLPQARLGDTIIEAVAPAPNKIVKGEPTVIVGG